MKREPGDTWTGDDGTEWTVYAIIPEPNAEAIAEALRREAEGATAQ